MRAKKQHLSKAAAFLLAATVALSAFPSPSAAAAAGRAAGGAISEPPEFSYGSQGLDFSGSRPYYFLKNDLVQMNIDPEEVGNNAQGSFSKGAPADIVSLMSNRENLDWGQFRTKPHMDAAWNDKNSNLDLGGVAVDGDAIVASGFAKQVADQSLKAAVRYSLPDDVLPAVKMEITLENQGTAAYDGFVEYVFDPDESSEQVSYTPGVGYTTSKNSYITEGWTENYLFNGPNAKSSANTAHTIVWPDGQQPSGLVNEGYISGVWFEADIPAGESRTYELYHVVTVPGTSEPYAEAARYADIISHGKTINQTVLRGSITDDTDGAGVGNVRVIAKYAVGEKQGEVAGTALTAGDGSYTMLVEKDVYTLTAGALRYQQESRSIDLSGDEVPPVLDIAMQPLSGARAAKGISMSTFGGGVEATDDDYVLENDRLALSMIDTASDPQIPRPFTRGRILDIGSFDAASDGMDWMYTSWISDRPVEGEQWARHTTRFDSIAVTQSDANLTEVTATGVYAENLGTDANAHTADVTQVATIRPGDVFITLETTVTNVSGGTIDLYGGDLMDYDFDGSQVTYAPGIGEHTADSFFTGPVSEPWIAQYGAGGPRQSYGIIYDDLYPGEMLTAFGYNRWIGAYRQFTLEDAESFTYSRRVAVTSNDAFENPWDAIGSFYQGVERGLDITVDVPDGIVGIGDTFPASVTLKNLSSEETVGNIALGISTPYQLVSADSEPVQVGALGPDETRVVDMTLRAISGGRGRLTVRADLGAFALTRSATVSINGAGWYGGDNHSHSVYSDGVGSIKENTDSAYAKGLSWLYSTDHNRIAQYADAETVTASHNGDFYSIAGNEISSSGFGHALAYRVPYQESSVYSIAGMNRIADGTGRNWQHIIDEVKGDGGFFYVAHPNYPGLVFHDVYDIRGQTGLEVWNGFYHAIDPAHNVSTQAFQYWDQLNARGEAKYLGIANSDGHNPGKIGDPYSMALLEDLSIDSINSALEDGVYFGTNGPQLRFDMGGVNMGKTLNITGDSAVVPVSITAFDELYPLTTVNLYRMRVTGNPDLNRELIESWDLTAENTQEWSTTYDLTVAPGEFYRVEIASTKGTTGTGGTGAGSGTGFAFSNPVWIEAADTGNQAKILDISVNNSGTRVIETKAGDYYITADDASALSADQLTVSVSEGATVEKTYDAGESVFEVAVTSADGTNVAASKIYVMGGAAEESAFPFTASTEKTDVAADEAFGITAGFDSPVSSNVAELTLTFDAGKFAYEAFEPSESVALLNERGDAGTVSFTVMNGGYELHDFGVIRMRALTDAVIAEDGDAIGVRVKFVYRHGDGSKAELALETTVNEGGTGVDPKPGVPGDLNGDGTVDLYDLSDAIDCFGLTAADSGWNAKVDLDGNGKIDIFDIVQIAQMINS